LIVKAMVIAWSVRRLRKAPASSQRALSPRRDGGAQLLRPNGGNHDLSDLDAAAARRRVARRAAGGGLRADLGCGARPIIIGTLAYSVGGGWSLVDGLYVAVATLTTSSVLDPKLTVTDPWLKVFTAGYVLVGIGILVEVARRLGTGFIVARAEVEKAKEAAKLEAAGGAGPGNAA
jgi:hypothetical protein